MGLEASKLMLSALPFSLQTAGVALPSFTSTMLASNPSPDEEYKIKMSAASIYSGGADTVSHRGRLRAMGFSGSHGSLSLQTVSAELTFILAMGLWPAVQKRAQEELDAVVGRDRLPTYADVARMPYLNAIYLETLRWNQVVPLGGYLGCSFVLRIRVNVDQCGGQASPTPSSRMTPTRDTSSQRGA